MVEELKLAIKVDDDAIEQSLLKQFANAEKMANKVVLTFNNIDLDDKVIEAKFKEMQKMAGKNPIDLSIDKSSIEMLSAISKQLGNIFDIAKGKSIIDSSATVSEINKITQATKELNKAQTGSENIQSKSFTTKNKTEAYNQLKQTADVFKQFYGNEEAMHTKAGTEAAYAYYKAYEEALRKGVAESKLQKVTVDVDKDGFFNAERISSTRIEEFANFEKYGGEVTALSEEISYFEKRLLKFSDAYSQIQSKLGKAPITPEIIQNIEEYVHNLEIAESRAKDADLMGFTKEDIDIYKDSANMYLGFAIEDAIKENEKYISSLKEVSEEKEKVDVSLNKSQTSDMDSSVVEQQNKIQEELKETQKQAEQTSESLSKIGDVDKSNISSGMKDAFPDKDVSASVESATNSIKEENNVLEQNTQKIKENTQAKEQNANVNLNGYDKRLDSYQGKINKYDTTIKRFEDGGWTSSTYLENVQAVKNAVHEYETLLNELKGKDASLVTSDDISKLDNYEKKIKDTIATVTNMSAAEKGYNFVSGQKELDKIHKLLAENSKMSTEAKSKIKAYYAEIESGNPSMSLDKIHGEILKIYNAEVEAGRAGRTLWDTLKNSGFHQIAAQMAGMVGVYDIINIFKQGANTLKEFDDSLTKISYTMDMTKSQLDNLGNSVLDMASDMKSSIDDAMQVAQIYANMQTSAEEIQKLSEPTLILSNLSGFDASTVADDIQAASQQFDIAAEDSMHIADVYDYISRNIQVDYSKGLESMAEGLQVAGSTAKQAGLDLEQTTAIIAKAVEKTRLEGSQVGNGLKTILTRLSKVGELSDEVDNETLSKASESLHQIGIEVYNVDGSYRQFDVIMGELAEKWDGLTDAEKSNLSYNIAATRQTNLLSAILSNFSDSMQLAEEATNANGSAIENQQKYMESFSGHLQSLETEAKIAWLNILDSETLKDGVDLLTGLVKVVGQLVDTFGLLGTTAGIGGIVAGFKNVGRDKMYSLSF